MKILLPLSDDEITVCPSFARAPYFMIYDDENKLYNNVENPASQAEGGAGLKAAQFVIDSNVDVVITPRCGENAAEAFKEAEIKIFKSQGDNAKENVELYLKGKLLELTKFHAGYHGLK